MNDEQEKFRKTTMLVLCEREILLQEKLRDVREAIEYLRRDSRALSDRSMKSLTTKHENKSSVKSNGGAMIARLHAKLGRANETIHVSGKDVSVFPPIIDFVSERYAMRKNGTPEYVILSDVREHFGIPIAIQTLKAALMKLEHDRRARHYRAIVDGRSRKHWSFEIRPEEET